MSVYKVREIKGWEGKYLIKEGLNRVVAFTARGNSLAFFMTKD